MTLYVKNSAPFDRAPHCAGVCTNIWHPVVVGSVKVKPKVAGVPVQFETLPRPGGLHQLAVNGHRLYTFKLDTAPGQTNGQDFQTGGPTGSVYTWSAVVVPSSAPRTILLQR
nr:hypothetical protein [Actinopolymorpha cephalotaxi]